VLATVVGLLPVDPPLDAAVVALVVELDDEELPQALTATAAAIANGIIFFKACLRMQLYPGRVALEASTAEMQVGYRTER
jgi:hypothetical protein